MNQPKVSIVSVNYNQPAVTCDMLASLRRLNWTNYEVIVVDNASTCDCSMIPALYPEVKYIASKKNEGFAAGNNIGIKEATGDYILLLNNDTIVSPGFLKPMIQTFTENKNAGIVSPVQYAGTKQISPITCRGETIGYKQKNDGRFDEVCKTHLCHGACMMLSREVLDKVGLMDESYFMYYEEYDYCERARKAGFEIFYNGKASILHKQSVTWGQRNPIKSYYMTRNRIYFSRKHFTGIYRASSVLYNYTIAMPKNMLADLLQGEWKCSLAIFKAGIWNLSHKIQRT
jgi:GT2 family glycosyltransferase